MVAYLTFELRRLARNRILLIFTVLMPVMLYVAYSRGGGGSLIAVEEMEIPGSSYLMVALAGLGAIMGSLSAAGSVSADREAGWLQQLRATPLRPSRVLVANGVVSTVPPLLTVVAIGVTGWVVGGVSLAAGRWLLTAMVLWWGVAPFVLLGLAAGYALSPQRAFAVSYLGWLVLSLLGGQMIVVSYLPGWLQGVSSLTPSYRYGELGLRAVSGAAPTVPGLLTLAAWTLLFGAIAAWAYRRHAGSR